jgi:hypothetical protein
MERRLHRQPLPFSDEITTKGREDRSVVKPDREHDVSDSMDKTHAPIITSLSCLHIPNIVAAVPLLVNLISTSDNIKTQAHDSTQRKDISIVIVGLFQTMSEKALRGLDC